MKINTSNVTASQQHNGGLNDRNVKVKNVLRYILLAHVLKLEWTPTQGLFYLATPVRIDAVVGTDSHQNI